MKLRVACVLIALGLGWVLLLRCLNGSLQAQLHEGPQPLAFNNERFSFFSFFRHKEILDGNARTSGNAETAVESPREPVAGGPSPESESQEFRNEDGFSGSWRQALALAEGETDLDRKAIAMDRASRAISDGELPAALDSLLNNPKPDAAELRQRLVRRWAEEDAPAAAVWAARLTDGAAARDAVVQVAMSWATTDSASALRWVSELPESSGKQAAILNLTYETARTQPTAALDLASSLPPTLDRDNALVHALSQWAASDFYAASTWAQRVSDVNLRQRLLGAVAVAVADQNGAAAASLAAKSLVSGIEQDRVVVAIVQRWAEKSPQEAAAWLVQFPDTPARDAAAQSLVQLWALHDKDAPQTWLQQLPQGSLRSVGLIAYAQATANSSRIVTSLTPPP